MFVHPSSFSLALRLIAQPTCLFAFRCESIGRLGHLRNLNLSGIEAIDDDAVASLITRRTAHTLETLTLAYEPHLRRRQESAFLTIVQRVLAN
jgi:hypothetical protein